MIRINLLGVERQQTRKGRSLFDQNARMAVACCAIFGLTGFGILSWYWTLDRQAARLTADIDTAQQEITRLQPVLAEVAQAEERRAQLQQRVAVIEDLRQGQGVPVKLLDHVSRSLPDMLWLTSLDQKANSVSIEGRTTTLISLADFVGNLGTNVVVKKPIDIVNSEVESSSGSSAGVELIKFSVTAPLTQTAAPPAEAGAPGGAAAPPQPAR